MTLNLFEKGTGAKIKIRGYELPRGDSPYGRYLISTYYYNKLMDLITSGALIATEGESVILKHDDDALLIVGEEFGQ